jgi:signal transduction histidine kinase
LIKLAIAYSGTDDNKALAYLEEAYSLAIEAGDSANIVKAGWIQGALWNKKEMLEEATKRFKYILPIAQRNEFRKDHKRILNSLAIISTLKANYDVALDYNFQSLALREQDGDKAGMSIAYNNIGLNYFKLSNIELALKFYNKSLILKKEIKDNYDLNTLLINIGLCHNKLGDFKTAKDYFYEGLSNCKDNCDPSIEVQAFLGLGISDYGLSEWFESKHFFEKSLLVAIKIQDKKNQIENLVSLSKVYIELKEYQQSKTSLDQALELLKSTSYKAPLINIYEQYYKLADSEKDYESASNYRNLYIQLRDSIYSEVLIKNLATIQTNFVEKENLATIETNKTVIDLQQKANWIMAALAASLCLVVALIFYQVRMTRKLNNTLQKQVEEATADFYKSHQRLDVSVKERDYFMYKTSHDIRGPLVTFIGLCNITKLEIKGDVALDYIDKLSATAVKLNKVLSRLQIVDEMNNRPIEYNFVDFNEIIDEIISGENENIKANNILISINIEPNLVVKSDSYTIRTILDNLISNAIKFNKGSERLESFAKVAIFKRANSVILQVIDNGIGFVDKEKMKDFRPFTRDSERSETGGVGLYLARLGAEKLEGYIKLMPDDDVTHFEVGLPLDIGLILRNKREFQAKLEVRRAKDNATRSSPNTMVLV